MPVETQEIRIHTCRSETSGEHKPQPESIIPASVVAIVAIGGRPVLQKGRYEPRAKHQKTRYKTWVKV